MSMHRSLATGLWLLAAAGAYAVGAAWADAARSGKVAPWALVALFWGVALVSVAIHHLSHYLAGHLAEVPDTVRQYGVRWRVQSRRLGRLLSTGGYPSRHVEAVALSVVPVKAAAVPAAGGSLPSGEVPSWTLVVVLRAVAGISSATRFLSNYLAQAQDALKRGWGQLGPAVGPYVGKVRLLRAAGGQSVALAARLGNIIGVR